MVWISRIEMFGLVLIEKFISKSESVYKASQRFLDIWHVWKCDLLQNSKSSQEAAVWMMWMILPKGDQSRSLLIIVIPFSMAMAKASCNLLRCQSRQLSSGSAKPQWRQCRWMPSTAGWSWDVLLVACDALKGLRPCCLRSSKVWVAICVYVCVCENGEDPKTIFGVNMMINWLEFD